MASKKDYTVEGGEFIGYRLIGENGPLTGRHRTEEEAVASYEAAKKAAADKPAPEPDEPDEAQKPASHAVTRNSGK